MYRSIPRSLTAAERMIPPWAMPTHQMNAPMYTPQVTPPPLPQSPRAVTANPCWSW